MNKFSQKNTIRNLSKAKQVSIFPLEMIVKRINLIKLKSLLLSMKFQF